MRKCVWLVHVYVWGRGRGHKYNTIAHCFVRVTCFISHSQASQFFDQLRQDLLEIFLPGRPLMNIMRYKDIQVDLHKIHPWPPS